MLSEGILSDLTTSQLNFIHYLDELLHDHTLEELLEIDIVIPNED